MAYKCALCGGEFEEEWSEEEWSEEKALAELGRYASV